MDYFGSDKAFTPMLYLYSSGGKGVVFDQMLHFNLKLTMQQGKCKTHNQPSFGLTKNTSEQKV